MEACSLQFIQNSFILQDDDYSQHSTGSRKGQASPLGNYANDRCIFRY
jgi:hypothetical protein